MYLNLIKMWRLHIFTKNCFKLLINDRPTREFYTLKYKNGVMFTAVGIDREIPPGQLTDLSIANKLAVLDEKMAFMNMAGLVNTRVEFVGDGADKTKHYFRVLFIPILHGKIWWITLLHIIAYITVIYIALKRFGIW